MEGLAGKVVLVTGASSGIGAATAIKFFSLGAKLLITGRNAANLERVNVECVRVGAVDAERPLMVIAELTSEADVARLVDSTIQKFGRLDVLVNNAGLGELGSIESTSLEQYDRIMNVNVRAVYQLTMLCVPHLIATRGNIINVSSVAGSRPFPGYLPYCMSKSAVDQLTKCTALELASRGVRVNSVNPGTIVTEIQKRLGLSADAYAKYVEDCRKSHPLRRVGDAEEVAAAVAFLASSNALFVTAECLHVDGGLHLS